MQEDGGGWALESPPENLSVSSTSSSLRTIPDSMSFLLHKRHPRIPGSRGVSCSDRLDIAPPLFEPSSRLRTRDLEDISRELRDLKSNVTFLNARENVERFRSRSFDVALDDVIDHFSM